MTAPSRLSKESLIELLINLGFPEDQVKLLPRPKLLELFNEHSDNEKSKTEEQEQNEEEEEEKGEEAIEALKEIEITEDSEETCLSPDTNGEEDTHDEEMHPGNEGWTQYVLGRFQKDEMEGKNPRVEGLRRVAEELLGDLIEEGCDLIAPPTIDNEMRACVKSWIVFIDEQGIKKRFEALADAYSGNCMSEYGLYIVAMADTRAKGRCYRNALKLKRVLAAEEIDPVMAACGDGNDKQQVDPIQLTGIRIVANRSNISIQKCLDTMAIKYSQDKDGNMDLSSITKGDAKKILQQLNTYSLSKDDIPDEIKEKADG